MKIQLGAIVTNMAGSAGGQSVRRFRNGHILQNKPMYTANQRVYQNKVLGLSSQLFRGWQALSDELRNGWNAAAPLYSFPDRFGNPTTLTGRQLYTKLTFNNIFASGNEPDPFTLISVVSNIDIQSPEWEVSQDEYELFIALLGDPTTVQIRAAKLKNLTDNVSIKKASFLQTYNATGSNSIDVKAALVAKFGTLNEGDSFMIVGIPYNVSGFKGAPQVVRTKLL